MVVCLSLRRGRNEAFILVMKRLHPSCIGLALLLFAATATATPEEMFTPLFNGKNLDGWFAWGTRDPAQLLAMDEKKLKKTMDAGMDELRRHWKVEKGALVNDGNGPYLSTRRFFRDFELRLEYETVARADSGVYLRGCPQVQIWDSTDKAKFKLGADKGSGGLWNNSPGTPGRDPAVLADKPFGHWNDLRVVMVGEFVSVWLNGLQVVDRARMENHFDRGKPLPVRGPIQLQTHGGRISWKNVRIREIGDREAAAWLRLVGEGFRPIFNGRDFDGWQGATDGYVIAEDGILRCKKGSGGDLLTKEEFADFELRFDFLLPPGGNNGVAVRSPAKGNPAWDAFEIQILDDGHPKYAKLKDYQFHASLYGVVPARRGFLRPTGEWNHQHIRMKGDKVQVMVNGFLAVDADLSKIDRSKLDKVPKGFDRKKGHLGFAGHDDPVAFRHIEVKRLD